MRVTADEQREIMEMHARGWGQDRISQHVRWNRRTVGRVVQMNGGSTLTQVKGKAHYASKLDARKVREIRKSKVSAPKLGPKYGVSEHVIRDVRNGRSWRHVI